MPPSKDWEAKRILMTYLDRWPTETFNEDTKGNLGFEEYQLRRLQGIKRHWYLSFVAYTLLGDQAHPGHSRWAVPAGSNHLVNGARRWSMNSCHPVRWIARHLQQGETPDHILHTLLA